MSNKSSSSSGGIGFLGVLAIVFVVLKVVGVVDWSWLWVLSPVWGGCFLGVGLTVLAAAVAVWIER